MKAGKKKTLPVGAKKFKQDIFEVKEPATLLPFLWSVLPDKSRSTVKSFLTHRQIVVDDKVITQFDSPLQVGQKVILNYGYNPTKTSYTGLKIVFEDDYLIVIEKQPGLLSIASNTEREQTAYNILRSHVKNKNPMNKIFILHRIDRETSGLMMFAKDAEVQKKMQHNWDETVTDRSYIALVEGVVEEDAGTISGYLKESKAFKMHSVHNPGDGVLAITHFKVLKRNRKYSLLEVELETGRKNQIRAHMQEFGHPIVGDRKYGAKDNPIKRIGLHAHSLSFIHPVTGDEMKFTCNIPSKFSILI
jgi:23S rRNA pseudouridine1911/1915/1917 synthase